MTGGQDKVFCCLSRKDDPWLSVLGPKGCEGSSLVFTEHLVGMSRTVPAAMEVTKKLPPSHNLHALSVHGGMLRRGSFAFGDGRSEEGFIGET